MATDEREGRFGYTAPPPGPPDEFVVQHSHSTDPGVLSAGYRGLHRDPGAFQLHHQFPGPTGYLVGLRQGTSVKGVNATSGQPYSPFGREKYWQKHRVEDRWVELIIQDVPPVAERDRDPDDAPGTNYRVEQEFVQGEDFVVDGSVVTGLRIGEYRGPVKASPDAFDMGILTAYFINSDGTLVNFCPAQLPSPFLRQYPYGVNPTPPFQ